MKIVNKNCLTIVLSIWNLAVSQLNNKPLERPTTGNSNQKSKFALIP
jgi:hypothetical protein